MATMTEALEAANESMRQSRSPYRTQIERIYRSGKAHKLNAVAVAGNKSTRYLVEDVYELVEMLDEMIQGKRDQWGYPV